jgi:hypothetical protein
VDSMTISGACIRLGSFTRFFRIMLEIIYPAWTSVNPFSREGVYTSRLSSSATTSGSVFVGSVVRILA